LVTQILNLIIYCDLKRSLIRLLNGQTIYRVSFQFSRNFRIFISLQYNIKLFSFNLFSDNALKSTNLKISGNLDPIFYYSAKLSIFRYLLSYLKYSPPNVTFFASHVNFPLEPSRFFQPACIVLFSAIFIDSEI